VEPMKHNIEFRNFEPSEAIRERLDGLITRLEKKARNFPPDVLFLRISIEEHQVRNFYNVSMTMEVPRKTLAAKAESHDIEVAIKDAFAEIERQLKEHKSRLRREHLWKRPARRAELREMKANAEPVEERKRDIVEVTPERKFSWGSNSLLSARRLIPWCTAEQVDGNGKNHRQD
jgi:ribosomal subunit interface protein